MPETVAPLVRHRVFPQRPSEQDVSFYTDEIFNTARPEDISDLHQGPIAPDEGFQKLREITLKRGQRDDMAFCPRCGRRDQFLKGWLIYLTGMEAIAFVGNDCASTEAGREADREWEQRQRRIANNEYLLGLLPDLPSILAEARNLRPKCEAAEVAYRTFKREGPEAWRALKAVDGSGGLLTVNEVMQSTGIGPAGITGSGGHIQTRTIQYGALKGRTLLRSSFNPAKTLSEIDAALSAFLWEDVDAMLDNAARYDDVELDRACKALRDATKRLTKLQTDLKDVAAFFASSNLNNINRWSQHPDCAYQGMKFTRRRISLREIAFFESSTPSRYAQIELAEPLAVPE